MKKPSGIFKFVTLPLAQAFTLGNSEKLCVTPWKFPRSKTKTHF